MKSYMMPVAIALMTLPLAAGAKPNNGAHGTPPGHAAACPPGLAKKSPACVPPGLAKKAPDHDGVHVGDRLDDGTYIVIRDPGLYGLDPAATYYRYGGNVYQVDQETREVLALIGAVSAILN